MADDFFTACLATVITNRKLASMRAALARCERRICCLSEGTVWFDAVAHCPKVGGLMEDVNMKMGQIKY